MYIYIYRPWVTLISELWMTRVLSQCYRYIYNNGIRVKPLQYVYLREAVNNKPTACIYIYKVTKRGQEYACYDDNYVTAFTIAYSYYSSFLQIISTHIS